MRWHIESNAIGWDEEMLGIAFLNKLEGFFFACIKIRPDVNTHQGANNFEF
jgi:hypothetical protein